MNHINEVTIYCLALIFQDSEKILFSTASDLQKKWSIWKKGFSKVPDQLLLKLKSQVFTAVWSHQLQPSQRLQQARRQTHPADDTAQRGVLLHLHQRAHLQSWLSSGRSGRPRGRRSSRWCWLWLLSHHRLDREGERPMAHAVNGPGLPVQAKGQRVELVVTGHWGRGRGSWGRGGLVKVRRCLGEWLGRVLPNWSRENREQSKY